MLTSPPHSPRRLPPRNNRLLPPRNRLTSINKHHLPTQTQRPTTTRKQIPNRKPHLHLNQWQFSLHVFRRHIPVKQTEMRTVVLSRGFQTRSRARFLREIAKVGVLGEGYVAFSEKRVFGLEFEEFEDDFIVFGTVGGAVEGIEPFLRVFFQGYARGDGYVGREVLNLLGRGEEDVGDGFGDEFLGCGCEGGGLAGEEPEGEGHVGGFGLDVLGFVVL